MLLLFGMLQLFILRSRHNLPWALQHYLKECFSSKRANLKELHERQASFLKMARVFLDVVVSWLHLTVVIAVSRAWAISTLKHSSLISHVLIVGT